MVNAAQPSYNQYGGMGGGGKLFSLQLTDGKRDALGIEYRPIPKFSGMDTPPGTKVMDDDMQAAQQEYQRTCAQNFGIVHFERRGRRRH